MLIMIVKLFWTFFIIVTIVGCNQFYLPHSQSNKIVFEKNKKIVIPEEIRKRWLTSEEFEEIVKTIPHDTRIVIMDEEGKNQIALAKEVGTITCIGSPKWSPDGKNILFWISNRKQKNYGIGIINSDGTKQIILTNKNGNIGSPQWSPNGKEIAFALNSTGRCEIYIADVNGKAKRKLIGNFSEGSTYPIVYSPNGKEIIFASLSIDETMGKYYKKYRDFDIWSVDIDGKNLKELFHNSSIFPWLSISPDGERIVYNDAYEDNDEIFIVDTNGNNKKRLTKNNVDDIAPIWSPNGKMIVYVSDGELWLMEPDGKSQKKLTNKTQCYVTYGVWSPDSKKIAFVAEGDIYTIEIDGKNLKNLTNTPDWDESSPSWRPIGK